MQNSKNKYFENKSIELQEKLESTKKKLALHLISLTPRDLRKIQLEMLREYPDLKSQFNVKSSRKFSFHSRRKRRLTKN